MNSEYIEGMKACERGDKCPEDASEAFIAGYSEQYQLEQVEAHRSER